MTYKVIGCGVSEEQHTKIKEMYELANREGGFTFFSDFLRTLMGLSDPVGMDMKMSKHDFPLLIKMIYASVLLTDVLDAFKENCRSFPQKSDMYRAFYEQLSLITAMLTCYSDGMSKEAIKSYGEKKLDQISDIAIYLNQIFNDVEWDRRKIAKIFSIANKCSITKYDQEEKKEISNLYKTIADCRKSLKMFANNSCDIVVRNHAIEQLGKIDNVIKKRGQL